MANEVRILVRVTNAAKAGFEQVEKEVDTYAKKFADTFTDNFNRNLGRQMGSTLTNHLQQIGERAQTGARTAGDRIGDTIGERAGRRISDRINESIRRDANGRLHDERGRFLPGDGRARSGGLVDDDDRRSFLSRMSDFGKQASSRFGEGFRTGFSAIFSGDIISTVIKGGAVVALGAALASVISAAITSALLLALGGGAIGAGVALAMQDPRIKLAVGGIGRELKEMADGFGSHFKGVVEDFLAPSTKSGGGLVGIIESLKPLADHLGAVLAPVAEHLGEGVLGFLQNVLPAIGRAMEASTPVINALADKLPGLGESFGRFLDKISDAGPEASVFFGDLIEGVGFAIEVIGNLINYFTRLYTTVRSVMWSVVGVFVEAFHMILTLAEAAFSWIPGLGPKLTTARKKFADWADGVRAQINKVPDDKTFTLRFRIVGLAAAQAAISTARILDRMGYAAGGAIGQAASGGPRSGRVWVGEHGPELLDVAPGSTVHSAGDSRRMAAAGGTSRVDVRLLADRTTERGLVDMLFSAFRVEIADNYGGDVQMALGR